MEELALPLRNLFFSFLLLISLFTFSLNILDLQMAVGERDQTKVLNILNSLDFNQLPIDFKCEVAIAYSEIFKWGEGKVDSYQEIAKSLIEELLDSSPTYWKVHYATALTYAHYVEKNLLYAFLYYKKIFYHANLAVKYGPNEYLAHLFVGVLNLETPFGKLSLAREHLLKALELNPNHVYTYVELGKYFEKVNDCKKAIEMYKSALKVEGEIIWKFINEEAKQIAREKLSEVEKKCTKK